MSALLAVYIHHLSHCEQCRHWVGPSEMLEMALVDTEPALSSERQTGVELHSTPSPWLSCSIFNEVEGFHNAKWRWGQFELSQGGSSQVKVTYTILNEFKLMKYDWTCIALRLFRVLGSEGQGIRFSSPSISLLLYPQLRSLLLLLLFLSWGIFWSGEEFFSCPACAWIVPLIIYNSFQGVILTSAE